MKKTISKTIAIGLASLSLVSMALADSQKTIYVNNDENSIEDVINFCNKTTDDSQEVIITSSKNFVDSIAGGVLIAEKKANHYFHDYLDAANSSSVYVIGGNKTISDESLGDTSHTRIKGETRYHTAVEIAKELGSNRDIIICSGLKNVDALAATSLATYEDRNILLVAPDHVPEVTKSYINEYGKNKNIIVIGGPDTISDQVISDLEQISGQDQIERISGENRSETSIEIASRFEDSSGIVVTDTVMDEESFLASIYASKTANPLVLYNSDQVIDYDNISASKYKDIYLFKEFKVDFENNDKDGLTVKNLYDSELPIDTICSQSDISGQVEEVEIGDTASQEAPVEEVEKAETLSQEAPIEKVVEEKSDNGYRQTGAEAEAKEWIAQRESNGSYTAYNPNGGYYGRYQLNPSLIHYGASPAEQEKAADAYVYGRYGSWTAAKNFWMSNGWY